MEAERVNHTQHADSGNAGLWKTRKTNHRFSVVSHSPWKSLRDSHIPAVATATAVEKMEIQRQDFHFPTAARSIKYNIKKGDRLHARSALPSGSSFD